MRLSWMRLPREAGNEIEVACWCLFIVLLSRVDENVDKPCGVGDEVESCPLQFVNIVNETTMCCRYWGLLCAI